MHVTNSYTIYSMILIVPIIYFGIISAQGFFYYFFAIFSIIVMPIPISIIFFAIMFLLMSFLRNFFSKKTFRYAGVILSIIFFYYYIKFFTSAPNKEDMAKIIYNFVDNNKESLLFWYPNQFSNLIIGKDILISLISIIGVTLGISILITYTIGKRYLSMLLKFTDMGDGAGIVNAINSRKEKPKEKTDNIEETKTSLEQKSQIEAKDKLIKRDFKEKKVTYSYILRDASFFLKNPMVLLNSVLTPVILTISAIIGMINPISKEMDSIKEKPNIVLIEEKKELEPGEYANFKDIKEIQKNLNNMQIIKSKDGGKIVYKIRYILTYEKDLEEKVLKLNEKYGEEFTKENEFLKVIEKYNIEYVVKNKEKTLDKILRNLSIKYNAGNINKEEADKMNYDIKTSLNEILLLHKEKSPLIALFKLPSIQDKEYILSNMDNAIKFLIPIAIAYAMSMFITISIFMFSKDKNNFFLLKTLPIKASVQFRCKRLFGIIVKMGFFIIYMIIYGLIVSPKLLIDIYTILGCIVALILTILIDTLQLLIDAKHPTTTWETPKQLVKGSLKSFLVAVVNFQFLGLVIFAMYFFVFKNAYISLQLFAYILSAIIILALIAMETYIYLSKNKLLNKLEASI